MGSGALDAHMKTSDIRLRQKTALTIYAKAVHNFLRVSSAAQRYLPLSEIGRPWQKLLSGTGRIELPMLTS
jgi:hypothetical protein